MHLEGHRRRRRGAEGGGRSADVVGSATTDNSGNFSMPYPYGDYVAARAIISLTPDSPVDIPVYTDAAQFPSMRQSPMTSCISC